MSCMQLQSSNVSNRIFCASMPPLHENEDECEESLSKFVTADETAERARSNRSEVQGMAVGISVRIYSMAAGNGAKGGHHRGKSI